MSILIAGAAAFATFSYPHQIGAAIVAFFVVIAFIQRIHAALVNDRALNNQNIGPRHFGLGPWNKFTYENGQGWRRIKATSAHGSPIFDAPYTARIYRENEYKKERRIILAKSAVILVVEIIIIKVLISPEPLSVLLELRDLEKIAALYGIILINVTNICKYWFGFSDDNGLAFVIIALFMIGIALSLPLTIVRHGFSVVMSVAQSVVSEVLYLLGVQWIDGAKVFDAPPDDRIKWSRPQQEKESEAGPFNPFRRSGRAQQPSVGGGWRSWFRGAGAKQQNEESRQPPPGGEAGDPFRRGGRARQQEPPPPPKPDPTKNPTDAAVYFGLDLPTFTAEDLTAAFRRKSLDLHPDRWGQVPEHVRKSLTDEQAVITATRDLLRQYLRNRI